MKIFCMGKPVMKRLKSTTAVALFASLRGAAAGGHDIYLTLDLKLQQYIETLLAGSRAAVIVTDPRTGGVLSLVSMPSYDPNLFVDGISSKDYSGLLNDPNTPLVNRATQGVYPPASTVKPYVAVSALSAGVITRNTSLFDRLVAVAGSEKRYRDWKNGATGI